MRDCKAIMNWILALTFVACAVLALVLTFEAKPILGWAISGGIVVSLLCAVYLHKRH